MKNISKNSIVTVLAVAFALISLVGPNAMLAATTPSLGLAGTFGVLGSTYTNTAAGTTITGDLGYITGPAVNPTVSGATHINDGIFTQAGSDQTTALANLNSQTCTFTFAAGAIDLAADTTHGPVGVYTPGVYCTDAGAASIGTAGITLSGSGTYIFRVNGALTSVANSNVTLAGGASASDVFWTPTAATTLGANSTFKGTVIDASGITIGSAVTWIGRALAYGGTVTTDADTITVPAPQLTVTKTVVNTGGGTKVISDFPLFIDGSIVTSGVASTTSAGLHTVSETTDPSYTSVIGGDCAANGTITLVAGDVKTCTITNTYIPPASTTLHIIKHVVNDNGGTAIASAFTINVTGTNVSTSTFAGSEAGVDVTLDAGSYAVTEPVVPTGYLESGSGNCSGTIAAGETKTCTITNDDIAPQLIVNKIVVNDNGGTKVISDFPLFIDGGSVTSGVASTTTIGLHTVSETTDPSYTSVIGGDCAANGTITLALGDVKTCTITNDDIAPVVPPSSGGGGGGGYYYPPVPPLIDVVKVPSPLALPDGPGPVTYTYTLRNIGTVPVNNITMVGDTCSPIVLVSGDINADAMLDVNEAWTYRCSTTLSKTHTNIVTATGWANGISATDIANATVIVGVPVIPPLIHVTKVPNPLTLLAGGGMITYTNKVTNPGTVALSNVRLIDDKCSPEKYIFGDTNGNSKLDTTETWVYTCRAKLGKTTVNTVTASGEANGLTARDFAIATVVVAAPVPKLPNTGLPPGENNIPWNIIVPTGIFAILTLFYFARRKQIV